MKEEEYVKARRAEGRVDDGGWKPGVGQLLGLVLGAVLVIGAIVLGVTTGLPFVLTVPLGLVGLALAFVFFRGGRTRRIAAACPHCGATVNAPSHISEFDCPHCGRRMETRASGLL